MPFIEGIAFLEVSDRVREEKARREKRSFLFSVSLCLCGLFRLCSGLNQFVREIAFSQSLPGRFRSNCSNRPDRSNRRCRAHCYGPCRVSVGAAVRPELFASNSIRVWLV